MLRLPSERTAFDVTASLHASIVTESCCPVVQYCVIAERKARFVCICCGICRRRARIRVPCFRVSTTEMSACMAVHVAHDFVKTNLVPPPDSGAVKRGSVFVTAKRRRSLYDWNLPVAATLLGTHAHIHQRFRKADHPCEYVYVCPYAYIYISLSMSPPVRCLNILVEIGKYVCIFIYEEVGR